MMTIPRREVVIRWGRAALVTAAVLVSMTVGSPAIAQASANDFWFSSYDADYHLTRDSQQHSQLDVIERLTAVFPATDQNHGIERAIPNSYDGHPVGVSITSVQDANGTDLQYTTSDSGGYLVLRIGDPGSYVHGSTQYVLHYVMWDVAKNLGDHDELYWNTNGTEWSQPFSSVTARLHLDGAIAASYAGRYACYQGANGSTERCQVTETTADGDRVLTFHATRTLGGHENLTMVAGFQAGTFATYLAPPVDLGTVIVLAMWGGLNVTIVVIGTVLLVRLRRRLTGRAYDRRQVVPTGAPPRGLGVLRAAALLGRPSAAVAAQLLDLAVRGYLRITEVFQEDHVRPGYALTLLRTGADLQTHERQLLEILFGVPLAPNAVIRVDRLGSNARHSLRRLLDNVDDELVNVGLVGRPTWQHNRYYRRGWLFALLGLFSCNRP